MANNTSHHILGTSTNLLGFCLLVLTSINISNKFEKYFIDEFTSIVCILLTISSIFSFFSIRTSNGKIWIYSWTNCRLYIYCFFNWYFTDYLCSSFEFFVKFYKIVSTYHFFSKINNAFLELSVLKRWEVSFPST